jgi:hypothetical protein
MRKIFSCKYLQLHKFPLNAVKWFRRLVVAGEEEKKTFWPGGRVRDLREQQKAARYVRLCGPKNTGKSVFAAPT